MNAPPENRSGALIFLSRGQELLVERIGDRRGAAADLARRCRMSKSALSMLLTGERQHPTLPHAYAIKEHAAIDPELWVKPPSNRAIE